MTLVMVPFLTNSLIRMYGWIVLLRKSGVINKLLVDNFSDIINVEFTAKIEEQFDEIAEGNEEWKKLVREFYEDKKLTDIKYDNE